MSFVLPFESRVGFCPGHERRDSRRRRDPLNGGSRGASKGDAPEAYRGARPGCGAQVGMKRPTPATAVLAASGRGFRLRAYWSYSLDIEARPPKGDRAITKGCALDGAPRNGPGNHASSSQKFNARREAAPVPRHQGRSAAMLGADRAP